ncbi:MAG TPA: Coq4 family protein [Haliangiales bacterium]|nr:Coq4 family protein [Haliangiales bacterium]
MKPWELYRVGQATVRVLADSTRTTEIHAVEEITGRARFRRLLEELRGDEILSLRPELCSDQVDYDALRRLPADSLGGRYVRHLDGNGLSADYQAAATRYVVDDDVAYLMRRFRQTHDVWHALVNLGIAGWEEVTIHAFSLGQLHLPVSWMILFFGGIKHGVLERRWHALTDVMPRAYRAGRAARPLMPVIWEKMWDEPIAAVRARYGIEPILQ